MTKIELLKKEIQVQVKIVKYSIMNNTQYQDFHIQRLTKLIKILIEKIDSKIKADKGIYQ